MKQPHDGGSHHPRESAAPSAPKLEVEVIRDASSSESDVLRRREEVMRKRGPLQSPSTLRTESRGGVFRGKRSALLLVFDAGDKVPSGTTNPHPS